MDNFAAQGANDFDLGVSPVCGTPRQIQQLTSSPSLAFQSTYVDLRANRTKGCLTQALLP
jgi:hypothetical protein